MIRLALLLVICSFQLSHSITCLQCRRFWNATQGMLKEPALKVINHLGTDVPGCAVTTEECEYDRCFSITYVNASKEAWLTEVRGCLPKRMWRCWTEEEVTDAIMDMPGSAKRDSFSGWYSCDTDNCNTRQDTTLCPNRTSNSTYEVVNEAVGYPGACGWVDDTELSLPKCHACDGDEGKLLPKCNRSDTRDSALRPPFCCCGGAETIQLMGILMFIHFFAIYWA